MSRRAGLLSIVVLAIVTAHVSVSAQTASVTGRLALVWGDVFGARPDSKSIVYLFDDRSNPTQLVFPPAQQPDSRELLRMNGQLVTARGIEQVPAPGLSGSSQKVLVVQQLDWVRPAAPGAAPESALTSGPQPWITLFCRFGDSTNVTRNVNTSFLTGTAYPSLDEYWRETSYNNINLSGSAVNVWVNLPQPRSYYIYDQTGDGVEDADLARLADDCTAASDATVDFSKFVGINMLFNQSIGAFAWGGGWNLVLDGVDRVWHTTWVGIPADPAFLAELTHETGHGFGLPHSSGAYGIVYDSNWDVMSNPYVHYDFVYSDYIPQGTIAYHKDLEGWVPPTRRYVAEAGTSATITLERLAQPVAANTYLMAQIPIGGSSEHFYTVEMRQPVGHDLWIPGSAVVIHDVVTTRSEPAHVVDPDNNGNPNDASAMWTAGESFVDAANGITVTVLSLNASSATVFITTASTGAPPAVTTGVASNLTQTGVTLNGTVNPNGSSTTAWFEYGLTTSYGSTTSAQAVGTGTSAVALSAAVSSLACGTLYHYRAVATSANGSTPGSDASFTTLACAQAPVAATGTATSLSGRGAIVAGTANPRGLDTAAYFEYGLTTSYGNSTPPVALGATPSALAVTGGALVGLQCNTQYHYRVVATSSAGTAAGNDATFTTPSTPCARSHSDFDGDGGTDLNVWRPADGSWRSLSSSSGFNPAAATVIQWGDANAGDVPLSGDIDGDGVEDPVVWRGSSGMWYWLLSSKNFDGAFYGSRQWGNTAAGDLPFLADMDGDGKADLIVWRPLTGTWFWLLSSKNFDSSQYGTTQWGSQTLRDVPLLADVDGDGKADLLVWRATTGTWYWLLSSRGYAAAAYGSKQWGAQGDLPLVGDVDGDGKSDLIVWRASTGTWYYLTSSSGFNTSAYDARQWGSQALHDVPLAADLDGDGRVDLVVWRPGTGAWHWLTSSSGYSESGYGTRSWGSDGDMPILK